MTNIRIESFENILPHLTLNGPLLICLFSNEKGTHWLLKG